MNREEAKDLFRENKNSYGGVKSPISKIDKIYDCWENQEKIFNTQYNDDERTIKKIQQENSKLKQQIEDMKFCGNCGYDNRNTKNNGGCFGCKDNRSGKTVYHGWKPKDNK